MVISFESVDNMLPCEHSNKSLAQTFSVLLFTTLYEVLLTFKAMAKVLNCDHLHENYFKGAVSSIFSVTMNSPKTHLFQWNR